VNRFIEKHYSESPFGKFLKSPLNRWMYIAAAWREKYLELGIGEDALHYIPVTVSSVSAMFTEYEALVKPGGTKGAAAVPELAAMRGKALALGAHERDYATLVEVCRGTGAEVHIVCNMQLYGHLAEKSPANVVWHNTLPQDQFVEAVRNCKYAVVPLARTKKSLGQWSAAFPMYFSKPVLAARNDCLDDFITHGETGFLYEPGNRKQMEKVLHELESGRGDMKDVGMKGFERQRELSTIAGAEIKRVIESI
jgi:hypothetical protein